MNWEELVEKAKELGYEVSSFYGNRNQKYEYFEKRGICFNSNGLVETRSDVIVANRTPDQMYNIMLALED